MVLATMPPFSKSGLQVLAGEYLAGPLLKWDEMSLFDQLFAAGSEPEMSVLTWELTELLCNMVIVVGPGSPQAYLLRVVLAPEFAWFGLHWAGMPHPAQVSTYSSDLLDLLHSRPLAASVALHQNLGLGDEWKTLVGRLWAHLEPYSSYLPAGQLQLAAGNENDILSRMEDVEYPPSPVEEDFGGVLPMEGVEFVSVSGVYIDTMIRDISPDMDVCAERGTVSAAPPAPMIVPPSLPLVVPSLPAVPPSIPVVPPSFPVAAPSTNKYRQRIKIPSSLDPPDNPASARGTLGTQKPKQTKSRNGCITCKAKRLKCDEIKPSCHQCERRKVECGGYKKDFKWRPFEEINLASGRPTVTKAKKASPSSHKAPSAANIDQSFPTPPTTEQSASPIRIQSHKFDGSRSPPGSPLHSSPISINSFLSIEARSLEDLPLIREDVSMAECTEPPLDINVSLSADSPPFNFLSFVDPFQDSLSLANSLVSDVDAGHARHMPFGPAQPDHDASRLSFSQLLEDENDDIEEIIRKSDPGLGPWNFTFPERDSFNIDPPSMSDNPTLAPESPEMLVLRFDKLTCGILSIKDGALENPWRTLIWPLAKDTPALRHAIFALTAFHSVKQSPHLRAQGNMRADAALATSLALAFADTWDQHTRTCIQHLRGAKTLMCQVIASGMHGGVTDKELDRIRFLYNTWSYMDVIARLTSLDECGPQNWDSSIFELPSDTVHDIDPLMGCATSLYPLMSRVAKLIQHVRKSSSNTVSVVAQAMELKALVEQWEPPQWFEPPDDPNSEVQHSIQVAHAYRWATLLYLHQAVPEIPSEPADELAKRVLILLATVPYTSRTTIIQMFPLLAAGAEVDTDDDRKWVLDRWTTIQSRLMLGGIDRCLEVLKEVWERRDAMNARKEREIASSRAAESFSSGDREKMSSSLPTDFHKYSLNGSHKGPIGGRSVQPTSRFARRGSALASLENIEFERTVRGRLHWVNVMAEWGWEVFLG
ncbi:Protein of unknown function DUF3468 [Penicillium expansum]|uniref:Zn(2)-C6 fungal-type domain-containing protein n=1 Tax=Penicillium expansum TaxID=27334 RepID=A0A0A2KD98_PENEN|nr:Protein of unknown function DUF3468 [Penicillium expansum]KGO62330.1 Protein of unknown function DUF3468 [Penicillium expansum]